MNNRFSFCLILLTLVIAWGLSLMAFLHLCTSACGEGQNWRLFGLPFGTVGVALFSALILLHVASLYYPSLHKLLGFCLIASLGAEVVFILVQNFQMTKWCPVCLGIAGCIALGSASFLGELNTYKGTNMKNFSTAFLVFLLGLAGAFMSITKVEALQDAKMEFKDQLVFGNAKSPIEIVLFTDWACPACRELEPTIVKVMPDLMKTQKVLFLDLPLHKETCNFCPYNMAFIVEHKAEYLKLRESLTKLSTKTKNPSESQIKKIAKKYNVDFQPLNFADVVLGMKYAEDMAQKYKVQATPTLVISNTSTNKEKILVGGQEITPENIEKTIAELQ